MLTQSSQVSVSDSFALQDMNQNQREGSLFAPSTPRISEHVFTTPEQTPEQPPRQRHRMGERRDQEKNQQDGSPQGKHVRKLDFHKQEEKQSRPQKLSSTKVTQAPYVPKQLDNESTPAKQPPQLDPKHSRSFSGHQSIVTTATERSEATSVFDDSEMGKYVLKRIEAANEEMNSLETDQMIPFKEEGDFEPLGSIGSLYDIVREDLQRPAPLASHPPPPLKPKPQLSSHASQTQSHSTPNGIQPAKASQSPAKRRRAEQHSRDLSQDDAEKPVTISNNAKPNGTPPHRPPEKPSKHREKRKRNRAGPALGAGESIMDRFHKISTSPPRVEDDGHFV